MSEVEQAMEAALACEPNGPGYEEAMLAFMWARIKEEDRRAEPRGGDDRRKEAR